tara:strand:+ start:548 stop:685 length:138 start_codon:yes stop_codon:yes gene_type:complete
MYGINTFMGQKKPASEETIRPEAMVLQDGRILQAQVGDQEAPSQQ